MPYGTLRRIELLMNATTNRAAKPPFTILHLRLSRNSSIRTSLTLRRCQHYSLSRSMCEELGQLEYRNSKSELLHMHVQSPNNLLFGVDKCVLIDILILTVFAIFVLLILVLA